MKPHYLLEINTSLMESDIFFDKITKTIKKYKFHGVIISQQSLLAHLAPPSPRCRMADITNLNIARDNTFHVLKKMSDYCIKNNLSLWLQGEAIPKYVDLKEKFPEFIFTEDNYYSFIVYFYEHCIPHILQRLPAVQGLRLSLSSQDMGNTEWNACLSNLHHHVRQLGRQLVLRDYQDKTWPRQMLRTTLAALPSDVRASVKATELEYRPGFASNPNLTGISGHQLWLEIDLWGLDYGWTLLPCYLLDELQQRLQQLSLSSATQPEAISVRIDWQWLPHLQLAESVNELNLYGLSRLIQEPDLSPRMLLLEWLQSHMATPFAGHDGERLCKLIETSYEWSCITPNLLGRILQCRSQPPESLEHALSLLHLDTRSANWSQSFQPLMPSDDPLLGQQQCQLIELENQRSHFLSEMMLTRSSKLLSEISLPPELEFSLRGSMVRAQKYTQTYYDFIHALTLTLLLRKYGRQTDVAAQLQASLALFTQHNQALETWFLTEGTEHPSAFQTLLNPQRIKGLINSLQHD